MGLKKTCNWLIVLVGMIATPAGVTFAAAAEKVQAEETTPQNKPSPLDSAAWEELRKGLDYGEIEGHEEVDFDIPDFKPRWQPGSFFGTLVLSIIILALLVLIIYLVVKQIDKGETRVSPGELDEFTLEELETNLPESDLERFLRLAIENADYRAAIRIYYLMALKKLNTLKRIEWEPEKTNNDYILELEGAAEQVPFRKITTTYEVIWYGEAPIDLERYERVAPSYREFITNLNDGNTQ